jgi:hypothetical protein
MRIRDLALILAIGLVTIFATIQTVRLSSLQSQYAELDNGAERSVAKATIAIENKNFDGAFAILQKAQEIHPELSLQAHFQQLLRQSAAGKIAAKEREVEALRQQHAIAAAAAEKEKLRIQNKGLVIWPETSAQEMPLNTSSTDVRSLYGMLSAATPGPKDQYETDEEYNARLSASFKKVHLGIYNIENLFVFSDDNPASTLIYDPKQKAYEVHLYDREGIEQSTTEGGTYEGQNAFGVQKEITRSTYQTYSLQFSNVSKFKKCKNFAYGSCLVEEPIRFPLAPTMARAEEGDLRLIYIVKLEPPFATYSSHTTQATISDPYETTYQDYLVHGALEQFRIVSKKSGKTLFQLPK